MGARGKAIQDYYSDQFARCYGCGRLNGRGLHVKSFEDGDETVCTFQPEPYHTALPGYVYGGLIASLIDCHGNAAAAAALYRSQGRALGSDPPARTVTASLHVDYLFPTPIGVPLELRARIKELKGRKVVVTVDLRAEGNVCARGEVVAVLAPERLVKGA